MSEMFSDFEIVAVPTDESVEAGVLPCEAVRLIAEQKGLATYDYLMKEKGSTYLENTIIISSDTLVAYDDIPLGKPRDESDAKRMLRILSGREHKVHTGIAVRPYLCISLPLRFRARNRRYRNHRRYCSQTEILYPYKKGQRSAN